MPIPRNSITHIDFWFGFTIHNTFKRYGKNQTVMSKQKFRKNYHRMHKTEADRRIEKIKAEVDKILKRLDQIEVTT